MNAGLVALNASLASPAITLDGRPVTKYISLDPQEGVVLLYNFTFNGSPFTKADNSGFRCGGIPPLLGFVLLLYFLI